MLKGEELGSVQVPPNSEEDSSPHWIVVCGGGERLRGNKGIHTFGESSSRVRRSKGGALGRVHAGGGLERKDLPKGSPRNTRKGTRMIIVKEGRKIG